MKTELPSLFVDERGITLVEIIIATVILVTVATSISLFARQAMRAITKNHARAAAIPLASTRISDVASHPYALIPVTPDGPSGNDYFTGGSCDCSTVNWDTTGGIPGAANMTSSETITVGGLNFTRQTCVNYVTELPSPAGPVWQSYCPTSTNDTGMKQIITRLSWMVGSDT